MRQKAFIFLGLCAVLVLFGVGFAPLPVAADPLLQDVPRLDGYKIYFTEENGEVSRFDRSAFGLSRFAGLVSRLGATLETLEWRSGFPEDADLVIIAGPASDFNADQTARLWSYMNDGGKVLLLVDPVTIDRTRGVGIQLQSGITQLLWSDMGVRGLNDIVLTEGFPSLPPVPVEDTAPVAVVEATEEASAEATAEATSEATPEVAADSPEATEEADPVIEILPEPVISFITEELTDDHPITQGISELAFFGARSVEIDLSMREFPVTPLVFSNIDFYGENNLVDYYNSGLALYNIGEDIAPGFLPLATAYENPDSGLRFVIIGDRDFATNGFGLQSSPSNTDSFSHPDNIRFLLNSITWMLDTDSIEVSFPTPGPTATATLVPTPGSATGPLTDSDISLTLSVSNERPVEGELILYELSIVNNGPEPAININLTPMLPNGLSFVLASGGIYDSATGVWTYEFLDVEEGITLRMLAQVRRGTVGTSLTNTFTVTGSQSNDPDLSNNEASIDVVVTSVVLQEE